MEEQDNSWVEPEEVVEEATIAEPEPLVPEPQQASEDLQKQLAAKDQELQELRNKQVMEQLQAALPDPNTNPQEYAYAHQQLEAFIAKEQLAQYQQRELVDSIKKQGDEFAKEQPDYSQALKSLYETRVKQYKIQAAIDPIFKDEAYIDKTIEQELLALSQAAADTGQNTAKLLYDIALANGYTKPNSTPKIEAISASRSLASSSGSQPGELTKEYLASLGEEELAKLYKKSPNTLQELLYK